MTPEPAPEPEDGRMGFAMRQMRANHVHSPFLTPKEVMTYLGVSRHHFSRHIVPCLRYRQFGPGCKRFFRDSVDALAREIGAVGGKKPGYLYMIEAIGVGRIKIGWTTDVGQRLVSLSTGSPVELELIAVTRGTQHDEVQIHKLLSEHRVLGEWFRPKREVLALAAKWRSRSR